MKSTRIRDPFPASVPSDYPWPDDHHADESAWYADGFLRCIGTAANGERCRHETSLCGSRFARVPGHLPLVVCWQHRQGLR